jgi:CubicO group peptidase (beta-lactamase class C family)
LETAFGLGFQLASELCAFAPDGGGFGHDGVGGSVAFADRRHGLGFAYVMNRMSLSLGYDRRGRDLVDAVYACL